VNVGDRAHLVLPGRGLVAGVVEFATPKNVTIATADTFWTVPRDGKPSTLGARLATAEEVEGLTLRPDLEARLETALVALRARVRTRAGAWTDSDLRRAVEALEAALGVVCDL
jgi:hypothetical protein